MDTIAEDRSKHLCPAFALAQLNEMNDTTTTTEIADWSRLSSDPLVSVYMLTYNHEKFIEQAIRGVIAQQCDFPIELVIGDDHSTDSTRTIVLDYQRRYPHLIRALISGRNTGALENARRCQDVLRGKFVAICEGDDYWHHQHKLQVQADMMLAHPEMTVCHTDFDRQTRFFRQRSLHRSHPKPWLARGNAYSKLLYEWSVTTATSMLRRDVFQQFRNTEFDNRSWPFGDYNRLLFASLLGPFGYIDESTATYRKTRGSIVNSGAKNHLKLQLAVEECVNTFIARHPVPNDIDRNVHTRVQMRIYKAAFHAGRSDLLKASRDWLDTHGSHVNKTGHAIRLLAIKLKFPIYVIQYISDLIALRISATPRS